MKKTRRVLFLVLSILKKSFQTANPVHTQQQTTSSYTRKLTGFNSI